MHFFGLNCGPPKDGRNILPSKLGRACGAVAGRPREKNSSWLNQP